MRSFKFQNTHILLDPHYNGYKEFISFVSWRGKVGVKESLLILMKGKGGKVTGYLYFMEKFTKAGGKEKPRQFV